MNYEPVMACGCESWKHDPSNYEDCDNYTPPLRRLQLSRFSDDPPLCPLVANSGRLKRMLKFLGAGDIVERTKN